MLYVTTQQARDAANTMHTHHPPTTPTYTRRSAVHRTRRAINNSAALTHNTHVGPGLKVCGLVPLHGVPVSVWVGAVGRGSAACTGEDGTE